MITALRDLRGMWSDLVILGDDEVMELRGLLDGLEPVELYTKMVCQDHFSILQVSLFSIY